MEVACVVWSLSTVFVFFFRKGLIVDIMAVQQFKSLLFVIDIKKSGVS